MSTPVHSTRQFTHARPPFELCTRSAWSTIEVDTSGTARHTCAHAQGANDKTCKLYVTSNDPRDSKETRPTFQSSVHGAGSNAGRQRATGRQQSARDQRVVSRCTVSQLLLECVVVHVLDLVHVVSHVQRTPTTPWSRTKRRDVPLLLQAWAAMVVQNIKEGESCFDGKLLRTNQARG